jgi:hypothetical protein
MTKYKLLQNLPLIDKDTVIYKENGQWKYDHGDRVVIFLDDYMIQLLDRLKDNPEWLEEIKEPERCVILIDHSGTLYTEPEERYRGEHNFTFATEQQAEYAKIRIEAVTKKDRFVPEEDGYYYSWEGRPVARDGFNIVYEIDTLRFLIGNCFPYTEQGIKDCEEWGKTCAPAWEELIKGKE